MKLLARIMEKTSGWNCCWWNIAEYSNILDHAHRLGLVHRFSTTQVHWTPKGIELLHKYS